MRKEKKNKSIIYVAVFIALIMITSVLGFILLEFLASDVGPEKSFGIIHIASR